MTEFYIESTDKRLIVQSHIMNWKRAQYDWTIAYETKKIVGTSAEELQTIEKKIEETIRALKFLDERLAMLVSESQEPVSRT